MKLSYLIVNLLLVGAGIFVYDTLRTDPAPVPHAAAPLPPRAEEPPAREEAPRDIVLAGTGIEAIQARLDRMAKRLEGLEKTVASGTRTTAVADTGTEGGRGDAPPAYQVPDPGDPDSPRLRPEEVEHFRALLDAVEKQRRDERFMQMIEGQLDRLEVNLRPEQKEAVVRETMEYREAVRKAFQDQGQTGTPDKRAEAVEPLRLQYETRVNEIVPGPDAQKIIENMGRYPGLGQFGRGGNQQNRPGRDR